MFKITSPQSHDCRFGCRCNAGNTPFSECSALDDNRVSLNGSQFSLNGSQVSLNGSQVSLSGNRVSLSGSQVVDADVTEGSDDDLNFADTNIVAEVLIPRPVYHRFSYTVPAALADLVHIGSRVEVSFGFQSLSALVCSLRPRQNQDEELALKPILGVFEPFPFVDEKSILLAEWMSSYYFESPGEVAFLFYPHYAPAQELKFKFKTSASELLLAELPASRHVLREKFSKAHAALKNQENFTKNSFLAVSDMSDYLFNQCVRLGLLEKEFCFDGALDLKNQTPVSGKKKLHCRLV